MYVLDTHVVSELRKVRHGRSDPQFAKWADQVDADGLHICVITILELEMGILKVERRDKRRGAILRNWLDSIVLPEFAGRVLLIDAQVAQRCARLHVADPRSERAALIAATALVHGMAVVTRNLADFEASGVQRVNPWGSPSGR